MAGIQVCKFHTEGVDHFEVALRLDGVITAVDALAHTHDIIRSVAVRRGHKGTFV